MYFYLSVNIGSLSAIATTTIEHSIGFVAAFSLPFVVFILGTIILLRSRKYYIIRPPNGSVLLETLRVFRIAAKSGFSLDAAKPSSLSLSSSLPDHGSGSLAGVTWTDDFIPQLRRALQGCQVFVLFPFYWLAYSQMQTNFISQAGTMETHGIPNDSLANIDPIVIITFIPLLDRWGYPLLQRRGYNLTAITRISIGFAFAALAMFYAGFLQNRIYAAPPCFSHPLAADCENGTVPNHVNVLTQVPSYFLLALSEVFASVTGLEFAYTKAPESMRSVVMALFLSTSAFGSGLAILFAPLARDPELVKLYLILGALVSTIGALFYFRFRQREMEEAEAVEYIGLGLVNSDRDETMSELHEL
jgi:dipeptide/tripeptide permease